MLLALRKFPFDSLSLTQKLEKLRVIELSFIRQGKPEAELMKLATEKLDHQYPADSFLLNRELVQLLAEGKSTRQAATQLGMSVKTAETHRSNVMRKLQLHSVSELVLYAVRNKLVQLAEL